MKAGQTELVFSAFDLRFRNGLSTVQLPLIKRKARLQRLFPKVIHGLRYSEHVAGDGPSFRAQACKLGLEGAISKQADRPYAPADRVIWVKSKCLNREEFVVVGWTDPEGSRSHINALLLGYYSEDGRLHYAGRAGTGDGEGTQAPGRCSGAAACSQDATSGAAAARRPVRVTVETVAGTLGAAAGCRGSDLTWTEDNLLRQVSYQGQREDKPARQVVRSVPHPPGR
jgi:bifunctional non-homologous end joining protein LigD